MLRSDLEGSTSALSNDASSDVRDTAAAAASVDLDSDTDSDTDYDSDSDVDSDDDNTYRIFSTACVFELKIDVHPETFEKIYSLRAVPYVPRDRDQFNHLDEDYRWASSGPSQELYKYFAASGAEAILERLKALRQNEYLKISNVHYEIDGLGVIGGTYGRYYFPRYASEFKSEHFEAFIRCADLILSNKMTADATVLNAEFTRQNDEYKLKGDTSIAEFKLGGLRLRHPIYQRARDLRSYCENKQSPASGAQVSAVQESMVASAQRMLTWLYGELAYAFASSHDEVKRDQLTLSVPALSTVAGVQERVAVIARLRQDQYADIAAQKRDLKRLFQLRTNFEPTEAHYNSQVYIANLQQAFWAKVDKPECWQDPVIIAEARKLLIESILLTDSILADMECFLHQAGEEPTASNMASLLANQQHVFCRMFICTGIIDFYPAYREKAYQVSIPVGFGGAAANVYKFEESVGKKGLFFSDGTVENQARKLYNTFIKDGFNRRYGTEKPDGSNDFRAKLYAADNRFSYWSTQDSKVNVPVRETWGQFFQRKIKGGDAPVVEELTYRHPLGTTRPT